MGNPWDPDRDLVVTRSDLRPWWPGAIPFDVPRYTVRWTICAVRGGSVDLRYPSRGHQSVSAFDLPRPPGVKLSLMSSVVYRFGSSERARTTFESWRAKYRRCANGQLEPGGPVVNDNGLAYRQPGFIAEYDDDRGGLGTFVSFEGFRLVDRYIVHVSYVDYRLSKAPSAPVEKGRTAVDTLIMDMARRAHRKARSESMPLHGRG